MDRNREARRASIVGSNGFNRRRHRTNILRDSPDEDGGLESQDSVRLRDRVKKDRDRERERERERERDRERERERERDLRERSSRSKRRRGERLTSNREDTGGDETSEESVNDDEDEDDEETTTTAPAASGGVRLLTPAVASIPNHHHHHHGHLSNHHPSHSSSFSQQQHNSNSTSNIVSSNHHLQHRKSFPPNSSSAKVLRGPPVWKSGDEMISVSIPRKARSASTKRSHDWISSSSNNNSGGGVSGEQNLGPQSSSPARQALAPAATPLPVAPMSPSSSNASIRKKLKPSVNNSGPKLKPPKVSSKLSSSNPEELEIEIAEVLYDLMTQSQGPSSKKEDSREISRLNSDVKSRNSSPISNSNPISAANSSPLSAVAPKRKRPRQIPENSNSGYGVRSSPVSAKPDADQTPKSEIPSPNLEKLAAENGFEIGGNLVNPQGHPAEPSAPTPPESTKSDLEAKHVDEESRESRDLKGEMSSPKERESLAVRADDSNNGDSPSTTTASSASAMIKANSVVAEMENQREEKFQIDLMAPPPQVRSSPEREMKMDSRDLPMDQKPVVLNVEANPKAKEQDEEVSKSVKDQEKRGKGAGEDADNKGRNVDLHLDLEKSERDGGDGVNAATGSKSSQLQAQKQAPTEKSGHSTSPLPLPMSMASWPGGLPPMGYMAPLQGVVSMDGGAVAPGHIQQLFSQPRPKRCATHCHIARNIHCLQQFMKMNTFWPPPTAGSASMFGSKPCNLNVLPAGDMHGNVRGVSNAQDKGQNVVSVPSHAGKDKISQPNNSNQDSAQRKQQILIQQALPPVAPSNLLGPAFIFPLNQQQSAVVARPSGAKSPANGAASNASSSAVTSTSSAATAMSFNYPNMGSNETQQYLAILQNNAYTFPIPTVGAPPNYRGTPAQAMPLFNGSFYSSPMIHPSQLQHPHPQSVQSAQLLQAHQNANASGGSSSSQKHLQSQQQRTQSGGGVSGGSQKTQPSQQYAHSSRPRHLEGELGGEESPSTTDSRGSRTSMNIYGQNFAMPIHPQNFALMTNPAALAAAAATSASSNQNDKKSHQQQQPGVKTGAEQQMPPHGFAMSFGTINGANASPGIDIASMAHNHAVMFQSSSEAAVRQNMQMMAAAQAAQKKNFRISDDGKSGGVDSSAMDDERKSLQGKGQSIAFARQDLADGQVTSIQANNVIESSGRALNVASGGGARTSRSVTSNAMSAMHMSNAHNIQVQLQQQQMMQQLKHQQQHQQQQQQQLAANAVNRSKVAVTSNGGIYTEHMNSSNKYTEHMNSSSSTMAAKFPNALSGFPQNLVQSNNNSSPSQSPQWKNPTRTPTPQAPSSTTTGLKNLPQQHSRTQPQMLNQISFGGNQKPSATQAPQSSNNQTPSSPMMVGSPTTSKGASGSPRTTSSASTNNKMGQASALSAQPPKNSPSAPSHKSPSILGNPHNIASSSTSSGGQKPQMQPQQQLPKAMQQSQLFFSNPYNQPPPPHSVSTSTTASGPTGYYMQRRRPDQHQQGPGAPPSNGGLSLCPPVTMSSTNTNDPATAIAAATANVKGGMMHASQFAGQSGGTLLPSGFPYVHPVQVKPAEQKQPAGNDNLHQWQPEKK